VSQAWCTAAPGGIRLQLHITPNAKKSEVVGVLDHALKIRLQAQPVEGKANDALIRYLADMLEVPRSAIHITKGLAGRRKTLEIDMPDLTVDAVSKTLSANPDGHQKR
jgi:uncharacterized protein (TIGR00251 family)